MDCNSDLPPQLKIQVFEVGILSALTTITTIMFNTNIYIGFMHLQEFLIQTENLKKGWILTGLPTTVDDFKHLDMMDTPPNR